MRVKILLTLAALSIGLCAGCKSSGRLEQGGAYAPGSYQIATNDSGGAVTNFVATAAPDRALFVIDSAFDLAYSTFTTVTDIERRNRQWLWSVSPDIKHSLDKIRPQASEAAKRFSMARETYLKNPTPGGLTELQTILSQFQNLAASAQAALPQQ